MNWTPKFIDTFPRPNGPIGNGWIDLGFATTITGNILGIAAGSSGFNGSKFCLRPLSEATLDQRVVVDLPTNIDIQALYLILRCQGDPTVATTAATAILVAFIAGSSEIRVDTTDQAKISLSIGYQIDLS